MKTSDSTPLPSIGDAIEADLKALQRERRRHFFPAFVAWVVVASVIFGIAGIRGSLLFQPWWQLLSQIAVWALCLVVLPAIGLGVIFPSRATKVGLVASALVLTVLASFDWSVSGEGPWAVGPCFALQTIVGVALLAIGGWSGAFVQRASPAAGFWISSGVALAALNTSTWHCADTTRISTPIGRRFGQGDILCHGVLGQT